MKTKIFKGSTGYSKLQHLPFNRDFTLREIEPKTKEELVGIVAKLNNSSVAWKVQNYCEAYRSLNNENYKTLLKICHLSGYSVQTIGEMLSGGMSYKTSSIGGVLKTGDFVIKANKVTEETLLLSKETKRMTSRMLLAFHKIRLTNDNFKFNKFKKEFEKNYTELKANSIDSFYDLFMTYC